MELQRLDKIIASGGRWSRREVKLLVRQGRVLVDGVPARSAEDKADPETAEIVVDGEPLAWRRHTWLMMNKPAGVLSATEDGRGETVLDLLPPELRRRGLFPVGRLDKDTEGLLLLTNEGKLAHDLLAPKKHVDKVYYAKVEGRLDRTDAEALAAGMVLGDGSQCHVTLREGKYHQVKRMLAARGKPVVYLKRLSMGPIALDPALAPGEWRPLTGEEKALLRRGTAGDPGFSAF